MRLGSDCTCKSTEICFYFCFAVLHFRPQNMIKRSMINEILPQASTDDINNALTSSNGNIAQAVEQLLPGNGIGSPATYQTV